MSRLDRCKPFSLCFRSRGPEAEGESCAANGDFMAQGSQIADFLYPSVKQGGTGVVDQRFAAKVPDSRKNRLIFQLQSRCRAQDGGAGASISCTTYTRLSKANC